MNHCTLTKLETELKAALRAAWRGEGDDDQRNALILQYVAEVGGDMYADMYTAERAIFDAEQARAKRQGWRL